VIDGRKYALKVMLEQAERVSDGDLPSAETRARREVEILRSCPGGRLAVPGPIGVTVAEISGQQVVYFTEEWIAGRDLRSILRREGPLQFTEVTRLGRDIALAIDALWALGVMHRDVKPGNIMLCESTGEFVLVDLGYALTADARSRETARQPGTRIYFSPERLGAKGDRDLDLRSDLFSLGVVLYEATAGLHPFALPIADETAMLSRIRTLAPLRPSSHRPGVPVALSRVIMRLMAKRPCQRYDSGALAAAALQACGRMR
jgi:serine/threonine protein kinase